MGPRSDLGTEGAGLTAGLARPFPAPHCLALTRKDLPLACVVVLPCMSQALLLSWDPHPGGPQHSLVAIPYHRPLA